MEKGARRKEADERSESARRGRLLSRRSFPGPSLLSRYSLLDFTAA